MDSQSGRPDGSRGPGEDPAESSDPICRTAWGLGHGKSAGRGPGHRDLVRWPSGPRVPVV